MVDTGGGLIPFGDEQAKAAQEALKTLRGLGGYLKEILGTVPEDLVGMLGGDWLRAKRAENIARIIEKSKERLRERNAEPKEPASLSVTLPLLTAAADESRDELQDVWARLLAAAAEPTRARFFRAAFIQAVKQLDPLDATVLQLIERDGAGSFNPNTRNALALNMKVRPDQIDISAENLAHANLLTPIGHSAKSITPFGREFLRAISD
jgi:Abortive infection alpha